MRRKRKTLIPALNYEQQAIVNQILNLVSRFINISIEDMKTNSRKKDNTFARFMSMYLMREHTLMNWNQIAAVFSKSHGTAIKGHRKIQTKIRKNDTFKESCDEIEEQIRSFMTNGSSVYLRKLNYAIEAIREAEEEFINLKPNQIKVCKEQMGVYKRVLKRNFFRLEEMIDYKL